MNRVREVIESQEELIAAQNVLIEWLLSQVHRKRRTAEGPNQIHRSNRGNGGHKRTAETHRVIE
jgi:hypothetical protein